MIFSSTNTVSDTVYSEFIHVTFHIKLQKCTDKGI